MLFIEFWIILTFSISKCVAFKGQIHAWKEEIETSLKRNIRFCSYNYLEPLNQTELFSENEFRVRRHFPTKHEARVYQELPVTLSKANNDLIKTAELRGYTIEKWGSLKESRWEIPSTHPGQDEMNCYNMTKRISDGKIYAFYDSFKRIDRAYYTAHVKNGFIHPSGSVMAKCGYYMSEESCENRWDYAGTWYKACTETLKRLSFTYNIFFDEVAYNGLSEAKRKELVDGCADMSELGRPGRNGKFIISRAEKVFIIDSLWDYNYHHFMADSLGRFIRFYDFLKKNKDIKIHIRSFEEYDGMRNMDFGFKAGARKMRESLLQLLGIEASRLIWGPVVAKEVYIPRPTRCAYALSNPIEMRMLAKQLLSASRQFIKSRFPALIPNIQEKYYSKLGYAYGSNQMLGGHLRQNGGLTHLGSRSPLQGNLMSSSSNVIKPSLSSQLPDEFLTCTSLYWPESISQTLRSAINKREKSMVILQRFQHHSTDRYWDDSTFVSIIIAFAQAFPQHNIFPLSSKQYGNANYSTACDFFLMSHADILVGAHGAGLTNMMFFPVDTLVVEIVGEVSRFSL
jgi:hypothetical protein